MLNKKFFVLSVKQWHSIAQAKIYFKIVTLVVVLSAFEIWALRLTCNNDTTLTNDQILAHKTFINSCSKVKQ